MSVLTREEAQQVLNIMESTHFAVADNVKHSVVMEHVAAIELLRARLAEPEKEQLSAADNYAHRLALMLECMLLSPDKTWNAANNLVGEYHEAVRKEHEAAGEPYVSGFGKD